MSFSGAVLGGLTSSFHSGGAKLSSVSSVRIGQKTELVLVAQRKKSLAFAVKSEGNILDDLNDATKKASDFVTDKTNEALKDGEKAKDVVVEKNTEVGETVADEAKKALDYVSEKGKEAGNEAAKFAEGKAGEAKDATK
ncbi:unnamed protein product [Microthlaspi erraticum]|uniref:Cold-responsive protein n=1 Tax=Microthlaspi erraticum TaxID=1685480 RepID=A0A6D2J4Z6_9BRAS|nr:unnamed protein product [Microthlaspi erraticum]